MRSRDSRRLFALASGSSALPRDTATALTRLGRFFLLILFLLRLLVVFFFFRGRFFLFLKERLLFLLERGPGGQVALAIEIDLPVDEGLLSYGIDAERIVIVNDQVGILAYVNRANAIVDAELDGGIERDQF